MINKISEYLIEKKRIIACFNEDSKYMCSGEYAFDNNLECIYRSAAYLENSVNEIFNYKGNKKVLKKIFISLIRRLFFSEGIFVAKQDNFLHDFSGSIYTPVRSTSGYDDRRIFDLENNKVLTIFREEEDYQSALKTYENFKNYFPMPAILWTNEENLLIVEELILFHPYNTWSREDYLNVLTDIFERYFEYFEACKVKGLQTFCSPSDLLFSLPEENLKRFMKGKINPKLFKLNIPCITLHGDLWTSNTLLIKEEKRFIKYIDWEYSKEFLFFYDFFTFMWLEVYMNNNPIYIEKYVKGDYDHYFSKVFSLFNIPFDTTFRLDYFHIFFLNFLNDRLIYYDERATRILLNQYEMLIEKLNSYKC